MKSIKLLFLFLITMVEVNGQALFVNSLTVEYKTNPLSIDILQPRLSWKVNGTGNSIMQTAYSVRVATDINFATKSIVWATGKINSDQSVLIPYEGTSLKSGEKYFWQVKIWDNNKRESKWSETAFFEMGLLSPSDWKAKWIEMDSDTNRYSPSPHFRKEFSIDKPVKKAVVYVTSHGFYELHLNGRKVGNEVLTPGWTSYLKRLQYQVYDITAQVSKGKNAVAAVLGDGWYRGTLGWGSNWAIYGKRLGLLMQMKVTFTDGTEQLIITDDTWKCNNNGALRMSDIYNGETYDATKKLTGWNMPEFNDTGWMKVRTGSYNNPLIASEGAPIRKIMEIKPAKVFRSPKGSLLVDMGQNMVGWIRLKVSGPKGTMVKVRHAEVLDKYGEFYTANLRSAKCELNYTLAGTGEEVYEPRFTFMGFRYLEITGFPGTLTADNITGIVVHSDMKPTGSYESSSKLLNQLQHNIEWGQRGNFVDVPTDCPQRDERLGWTGDAQAFSRTAAFNFDVAPFFTKWLKDLAADQKQGGEIPDVIPDVLNRQNATSAAPSAGWGDVGVIVPWTMYTVYGDKRLLEAQYPSMKNWVEYIRKKAGDSYQWKGGSKYGDWLFYHPPVNSHTAADGFTEHDFIASAYFAYSASLLAQAAEVLGKTEDQKFYSDLFGKIKDVFIKEYVTQKGRVGTCSQTSYVLALKFNLLPDNLRQAAADFLVADIKGRGNHLSTGFLGTIYLNHVLSQAGYSDVAYDLLLQETYPSWIYPVKMGATTIWERWDGQKTDSTFQDIGMNSFNHYAYGAIGDWMYRVSSGIEAGKPGYKEILIQPTPGRKLEYSKAKFESLYGTIESGWIRKNGKIIVTVKIPANTEAIVLLPVDDPSKVSTPNLPAGFKEKTNITVMAEGNKKRSGFMRGSGEYTFEYSE